MPAGVYSVTLTMGDGLALRDEMGVFLEGELVDSVTALAATYETRSFEVTVTDGQLTLGLEDLGGANTLVMINSLNLVQIGGDPSGPQVVNVNPEQEAVGSLERIILTFNKHLDSETFTTADVTLSGPDGSITPTAVTALFGDMYEILFDTQTTLGEYSLTLSPDVADLEGHLMKPGRRRRQRRADRRRVFRNRLTGRGADLRAALRLRHVVLAGGGGRRTRERVDRLPGDGRVRLGERIARQPRPGRPVGGRSDARL